MGGEYTSARRRPGRRARGGRAAPGAAGQTDGPLDGQEEGQEEGPRNPPKDPESRAREICLQQLTLAPKTRAQLGDALRKKGIPDDVADMVLGRFTEVGLIDDAAFARAWVESRHYSKGLAGRALSAELRRRGVDDDEIREAVATLDPEAEVETARRLVQRRLASTRGQPTQTRTRKLAGMLARKGYPAGLAFRVIREALEAEGADAELEDDLPDDPVDDDFDRYTD
ncbi:MAG TPA: regulatory protein RecX [Trebonia sp.]|jgi:regulatory protein|nr:regulatory protein RecX [Trebonia sp.]